MTSALTFRDHAQFQRSALLTLLAGIAGAVLTWLSARAGMTLWPALVVSAAFLAIALHGPAHGFGVSRGRWHLGFRALLLLVGLASLVLQDGVAAQLGFGVAFAAAFAIDRRGWSSALVAAAGGLGAVVALEVAGRMLASQELSALPAAVIAMASGAGFGLALAIPIAVRHLELAKDFVRERYAVVSSSATGEVKDLVGRGFAVWNQASELSEGDENRSLLREAVLRLFDTAEHCTEATKATSKASLQERIAGLQARIDATTDPQVRSEYEQAHRALGEQIKYLDGITVNRERVIARLHNYLAAMERLHLAVASAKSSQQSVSIAPMATTLEELGRDIETDYADI